MTKVKKEDGKTKYFVPKAEQSSAQKKKNGSNYFEKKYMTKEQREAAGI